MGEELKEQVVDAGTGAAPEGASTKPAASGEATTGSQQAPDIQAQIDAALAEREKQIRAEYEGTDGHLSRVKSKKDKEIAALRKQLRERQQAKIQEAKALLESNPEQAAQILLSQAEEQAAQVTQEDRHQQMVDWQHHILHGHGVNPDEDEEAAALVSEWARRIDENPDESWNYIQAAGVFVAQRERNAAKEKEKELKQLQESLPETVKAEVTRALVDAGVIAAPTPEGGAPPKDEDWRKNPSVSRGLEKRRKQPIQRT